MAADVEVGPATPEEGRLAERRATETLVGSVALRWRSGWAASRTHCFVVRRAGEILSSVFLLELPLYWPCAGGGTEVRVVGGMDALVTPVRHRRKGFAGLLLEWVNRWAAEKGLAATALFSEIGTTYYRERGYRLVPLGFLRGPLPSVTEAGGTLDTASSRDRGGPYNTADLDRVVTAYSSVAARYPLSVARDLGYWTYHLEHSRFVEDLHSDGSDTRDFVVAHEDGVAYVRSRSDGDIFTVLEAVSEPGAERLLTSLLESEMYRAARDGCLRVVLHLHPGIAPPAHLTLRKAVYETFLVRPTPGHAEALDDLLNDASPAAPPYVFRPDYF
ncbi:MAG: GNAT family N-acetyltransferase [Thermoleophilia bacterium]